MPLYPHTLMHGGSGSASGGCEGDSTGGSDSGASGHGDEGRGAGSREGRRVGGRGAGGHDGAATTGRANSAGRHSRLPACRFGLAGRMRGVEEKCALPSNCAGWAVTVESAESTGVRCAWTSSAFTDRQASRKKASLRAALRDARRAVQVTCARRGRHRKAGGEAGGRRGDLPAGSIHAADVRAAPSCSSFSACAKNAAQASRSPQARSTAAETACCVRLRPRAGSPGGAGRRAGARLGRARGRKKSGPKRDAALAFAVLR